jgi:hypothetical protein
MTMVESEEEFIGKVFLERYSGQATLVFSARKMARSEGIEPPTCGFGIRCSTS